jgi:hypothetical protein
MAHVNPVPLNGENSDASSTAALGPQYSLNRKLALGGTWDRYRPEALSGQASGDPYSFGIRAVF